MCLGQLAANCQNLIVDLLPMYDLRIDKLSKFLEDKVVKWKSHCDSLSEAKYIGFGTLDIDSIMPHKITMIFSFYYKTIIFKEYVKGAWGIYYIRNIPILLHGIKSDKIVNFKGVNKVFRRSKDCYDGSIEPEYIRIVLHF